MNVAFPRRDRITHEARRTNAIGGTTWCGVTFYWDSEIPSEPYPQAVPVPEAAGCDCMACIARPEALIKFSSHVKPGIGIINARSLARLEFSTDDKEPA